MEFFRRLLRKWAGTSTSHEQLRAAVDGQRRVEEERRQIEDHFEQLVAGVRDYAVFLLDRQGNVLTWNSGVEQIKGYKAEEIVGQHFSRFYPQEAIERGWPAEELRRAAAEGRFEDEGWRLRKDGSRFWANIVITALREKGSEVRGFLKITRDLTERKQAEENARRLVQEEAARRAAEKNAQVIEAQQEQLRVTLTSIGDAVITTDAEGRITLLNPVAETLTGWTKGNAIGQSLQTVFHIVNERTRQAVENPVTKVLATGGIVGLANHTILIAKDGTERGIDDSGAPIRDSKGNVTGVVLVFRDVTERRKAEQSARFLASIVESSDDAIIGKDVNGIITSWNQAAERLFGYSAAEAVGRPIAMLAPPNRADEMPAILAEVRRGQRVEHFDTVRRAKDGRLLPISLTVSPIKDDDGNIIGASKIARDISERKRAEEALREEKARLHATLTSIGDAVIVTDAEGSVTLMNSVAQTLTGWNDEATGRPLEDVFRIINEQSRQSVENPVKRVICEGTVVGLANHTLLIAKDGTERPIDDSAAPIKVAQGRIAGVVLVFRDTTERRQAEEALRRTSEQLQIVTESMAALITRCSHDLKFLWVSKPYADWVGRPANEIAGRPIIDIMGQEAFEQLRPYFEQVLAGKKVQYEEEVNYRGLGLRWINAVYTPTFDAKGAADGWVAVVLDNTDRKRMEVALKEADRRKDEFLATLAHELRNPLAPICNAVEFLRRANGNGTLMEQARSMMERQLAQMVRLIDDLLDISRITRGKLQLRREPAELAAVVSSAVESSRPVIDAQAHQLTVTLPPDPIHLDADPIRLAQVFSNLLNNAAKYTEKGGHIWLTAERQVSEVVVSVWDTGIGIAAEHLPRLFEMFSQIAPALERSQGGLGIGLALVRGLVELHGGRVEARSAGLGKGSEFVVHLPIVDMPMPAPTEPVESEKHRASPKRRILIVDDNRDAADSMVMMLRMMGHETSTAYDGLEAVQAAATFRPDVILLDIGLPKMNGYEVALHIRKQPWGKGMALIALTGWGQEEDKRRALEAGFDHHLTKPVEAITLERLLALVNPVVQG